MAWGPHLACEEERCPRCHRTYSNIVRWHQAIEAPNPVALSSSQVAVAIVDSVHKERDFGVWVADLCHQGDSSQTLKAPRIVFVLGWDFLIRHNLTVASL